MKKILLLFVFVVSSVYAENAQIIIQQKSGNKTIFELSSNPVVTFNNATMVITNDFTNIAIPIDDIEDYTVNDETTGITPLISKAKYVNNHVLFMGLTEGSSVSVFTLDGKYITRQKTDKSGVVDVSLEGLPKGVYIINSLNHKIKIHKK